MSGSDDDPEWVKIVVPIVSAVLFVLALLAIYFMKNGIPSEKLKGVQEFCLKLTELCKRDGDHGDSPMTQNTHRTIYVVQSSRLNGLRHPYFLRDDDFDYDSLSRASSYSSASTSSYFYGSMNSIVLETNV